MAQAQYACQIHKAEAGEIFQYGDTQNFFTLRGLSDYIIELALAGWTETDNIVDPATVVQFFKESSPYMVQCFGL